MYEQQKREFEEALVRSELKPTPGGFWIVEETDGHLRAEQGKACALSAIMLVKQLSLRDDWPKALGVSDSWVAGAMGGFDDVPLYTTASLETQDGRAWGQYMREKYVREVTP